MRRPVAASARSAHDDGPTAPDARRHSAFASARPVPAETDSSLPAALKPARTDPRRIGSSGTAWGWSRTSGRERPIHLPLASSHARTSVPPLPAMVVARSFEPSGSWPVGWSPSDMEPPGWTAVRATGWCTSYRMATGEPPEPAVCVAARQPAAAGVLLERPSVLPASDEAPARLTPPGFLGHRRRRRGPSGPWARTSVEGAEESGTRASAAGCHRPGSTVDLQGPRAADSRAATGPMVSRPQSFRVVAQARSAPRYGRPWRPAAAQAPETLRAACLA